MKQLWTNFQICSQPSRNLKISLQHLHTMLLKISSSLRKPKSGFLDIGKQVHFTHTFRKITSTQVDIFLMELDTFDNSYKNLKNGLIPVNTARNKSGNPPEQLRPENCHFLIPWSNVTKRCYNINIHNYFIKFARDFHIMWHVF